MADEDEDAPPLPDEPPPLPEGLPPEVEATEATSSTTPVGEPTSEKTPEAPSQLSGSAVAGGHTPESIARLPPKLRQRLVQRGILKEEDVKVAMSAAQGSASSPPAPQATPTNITGAVVKAAAPAPQAAPAVPPSAAASLAWAQAAAARVNEDLARMAMAKAAVTKAAQPKVMAPMSAEKPAMPKQPVQHPGMSQQVYSAAPVICKEAVLKRPPEEAEAPFFQRILQMGKFTGHTMCCKNGSQSSWKLVANRSKQVQLRRINTDLRQFGTSKVSEAKRSKVEVSSSPAEVRAAAARAEGQEAPVWLYETKEAKASAAPPVAAVPAATESPPEVKAPPPAPEATGPPLPPGWVSWEHPAEQAQKPKGEKKPKFTEEHKVLWTDIGKIIGRQGMNLKIIKASIGCDIHIPKQDSGARDGDKKDGKGKGGKGKKDAKGKSKGKRDAEGNKIGRGIGDGSTKLADDQFCTVTVTGDTALKANGGKRCIQIMLGYGRNVERALADLGVEAKMPSLEDMTDGKSKPKKDEIDPMDPASYSDAPVGNWSAGLKKPGQKAPGGGNLPRDSKQANAERF
eukprot:s109_g36.t2